MDAIDYIYFALPLLLWPLSFIIFRSEFIYAMTISTFFLGVITLARYRNSINWGRGAIKLILAGIIGTVILYALFLLGYNISPIIGLNGAVLQAFSMIYSANTKLELVVLLALIGIFEEIYWRGGVQGFFAKNGKIFQKIPWVASTIYYTCVHISTLNLALVAAAFLVGITTSLLAYKFGIVASIITHIAWIEAIIVFLPIT